MALFVVRKLFYYRQLLGEITFMLDWLNHCSKEIRTLLAEQGIPAVTTPVENNFRTRHPQREATKSLFKKLSV